MGLITIFNIAAANNYTALYSNIVTENMETENGEDMKT